tara:strand:+ start:5140 stop:5589 length:450 start_codon:yes stop_codon:yes gene_type:complete
MKLNSLFVSLLKNLIVIVLSFSFFNSTLLFANAMQMNTTNGGIVEELRLNVPIEYKETWIKAEKEIWEPWLAKQEGFLGRKIFYNNDKGEALLLVNWKNRELWKSISSSEVDKMQKLYEENIKNSLKLQTNPFELIYEGELFEQNDIRY